MSRTVAIITAVFITACALLSCTADIRTVSGYIRDRYGYDAPVIYTEHHPAELTQDRNGTVYVQVLNTKSCGAYGKTQDGYKVKYNTPAPKGKAVTCYLIYNPYNNFDDDVVAVVDHGRIR